MGKESACSAEDIDAGLIPGLGRSPGGGHGNPLQCSCLENPMDRGGTKALIQGYDEQAEEKPGGQQGCRELNKQSGQR